MAPRASWKGYLKLSLVSCPIALYPAASSSERVSFNRITATTGTWTHNPTSFTYQWKFAGTPISGATASTYVPIAADVGNTLTVSVVATNSGGSSSPATSAATNAVAAAGGVPVNTVLPAIYGTAQVGQRLVALPGNWTNPDHATTPVDASYSLVFDEEFNGSSLDNTKWNPNWFGTAGQVTDPTGQWPYSLAAADPAQITIAGGFLALTTINNPITIGFNSYTYRSGHIDTNPSASVASPGFEINPTAGNAVYLEARMYIPPSGGNVANWPSFWTGGQNWPVTGEIDIAEAINDGLGNTGMTANYHSSGSDLSSGLFANRYSGWHIFAALWTTSSVTYYYDGAQVKQYTTGIVSAPHYILIDNNMHSGAAGPNVVPASMLVDYVHVYLQGGLAVTPQANYGGASAYFSDYLYQWKRAGTAIGGATASTYVPVSADVGNTLTVSVTATNGSGFSTPATSAATSARSVSLRQ